MSWLNQPFTDGAPIQESNDNAKDEKPFKRSSALIFMLPGQLLFWGLTVYLLSDGQYKTILGLAVYVILSNLFSGSDERYDIWTIQYWSTDIFLKFFSSPVK